jgi:type IV pilus assembly protein PilY1
MTIDSSGNLFLWAGADCNYGYGTPKPNLCRYKLAKLDPNLNVLKSVIIDESDDTDIDGMYTYAKGKIDTEKFTEYTRLGTGDWHNGKLYFAGGGNHLTGRFYSTRTSQTYIQVFSDDLVFEKRVKWGFPIDDDFRCARGGSAFGNQAIEVTANGIYTGTGNSICHYSFENVRLEGLNNWDEDYTCGSGGANSDCLEGYTFDKSFRIFALQSDSSGNIIVSDRGEPHGSIRVFDPDFNFIRPIAPYKSRMDVIMEVLKKLTSDSDLVSSANFGLQLWADPVPHQLKEVEEFTQEKHLLKDWTGRDVVRRRVDINIDGAGKIYNSVKDAKSGITDRTPWGWYAANGYTHLYPAMVEARDYFLGADSPLDPNASCQKNFLLVISDGEWGYVAEVNAIATELLEKKGIQTIVTGFSALQGSAQYTSLAKAGGTYPTTPIFADQVETLYEALYNMLSPSKTSRLTVAAPVVVPNLLSGNHIFQSTFTYEPKHQWKGQLSKYKLNSNGSFGALQWEAGTKLDAKNTATRKIWTVANKFGVNSSLNNFTTSNLLGLKEALWEGSGSSPTNTEATNLINFVRGIDAYDENSNLNTSEKRWKLGDIYNSKLVVVGKPNSKTTDLDKKSHTEAYYRNLNNYANFKNGSSCGGNCKLRDEVVYVGANDGMLHAFDSATGEELWAFIPPMMLQSLRSMVSVSINQTKAIYGVDGSPTVKDIYYDNKWRSVLISGMGRGGKGYFALDITNPSSPKFLFAFENKPTLSKIYHWDASGTRTDLDYSSSSIAQEYDYSKLGDTMSTPVIVAMPEGSGRKWVAVFGAGYNAGINEDYASAIYVVDLEDNGKVLKRIDLTDSSNSSSIANAMPSALVSVTPDTTNKANYQGSMIYGVDLEGKHWQFNLTNTGTLYDITQTFDAEATYDNDRMAFFQTTPAIGNDNNLWSFYGTGNQQKLERMSGDISNRIFGLKDKNFPTYVASSSSTAGSSSMKNVSSLGSSCSSEEDGWYLNLGANERVTGKLAVHNSVLYSSSYTPNSGSACSAGSGSLTEYSLSCGSKNRKIDIGEGIPTGAVIFEDKIYIGISGSGSSDILDEQDQVVGKKTNNLIVIDTVETSGDEVEGKITQEAWREIF